MTGEGPDGPALRSGFLLRFVEAGLWPGMPRSAAAEFVASGIETPVDVSASALVTLPGIGLTSASRLVKALTDRIETYDVAQLLDQAELPLRSAARLAKDIGAGAGQALRANPWRLLVASDRSLTDADRLAASVGLTRDHPLRGPAVIGHLLELAARQGHTAWPAADITRQAASRGVPEPATAVADAVRTGAVVATEDELVALERYAVAEEALADGLTRLTVSAKPWSAPTRRARGSDPDGDLDDAQRAAVAHALEHGVSVLTGGPGTGKSRTVAALVRWAAAHGHTVALAAPTGRAAKRLEELSDSPASTLHRLLGAQGTTGLFTRDEDWPIDAQLVVVDETSMLDTELAAALVAACTDGTHLLLVGDPAQLPSIGAGRVLGDVLESARFPTTALQTLYRQDAGGTIARLAADVRVGRLPAVDDPTREVVIIPARGSAEAAHRVVQLVTDSIPRALGIDPRDVQVVTPVHRGAAGTRELNRLLKQRLNPGPGAHRGFDPGDRVVALANRLDAGFTNGEVGMVAGPSGDGGLRVAFSAGEVEVPRDAVGELVLGFAITVHRAQGSEWPALVVVLPPEASGMLSRPLVYTALTRARRHLSVVPAVGPALARAVAAVGEQPRTTRLTRLLVSDLDEAVDRGSPGDVASPAVP
jgi:exodeoxyribonuclease V alpha subunit